ncbi:hypothetical protein EVAR_31004_1 [Eumeta japonica]|uniref:Uncharacterized protein n=1 Tax=Eumeta variegata TaxID=151549 RepID=A0A4C1VDW1_EUMVA|nr:hypothetical protein EVAR_31004_1 [Eumeta japonica]
MLITGHIPTRSRFKSPDTKRVGYGNVWAGVYGDKILGPVFLPARMNDPSYLESLRDDLDRELDTLRNELDGGWEALEDVPLAHLPMFWFQHDGAPPHITLPVHSHLNATFPNRWLDRFDLKPLDFFFVGLRKGKSVV